MARIDAPHLEELDITFFFQPTLDALQLGRFIDRTETLRSYRQAHVVYFEHHISISFTRPGALTQLGLQISCEQLDWQLSSIAQFFDQISPILSRIEDLEINTTKASSIQNEIEGGQWMEIVRAFGCAQDFYVSGKLATEILYALCPADGGDTTALPSLRELHVKQQVPIDESLGDAVMSFIMQRQGSDHSVQFYFFPVLSEQDSWSGYPPLPQILDGQLLARIFTHRSLATRSPRRSFESPIPASEE